MDFSQRLRHAFETASRELLAARTADGHWAGELSSSALSTATAVAALAIAQRNRRPPTGDRREPAIIARGLDWLARHANTDGGWGDTTFSLSNISTTTLCWAAFGAVSGADEHYRAVVHRAEAWLVRQAGSIEPSSLAAAMVRRYGKDRTFSAPILTTCALSGRLGSGAAAWDPVLALPFELASLPHPFFAALRLPVVSYALPALIAIGQARHHHLPSRNRIARVARSLARGRTLRILAAIQPASGGFLEATPLTSFVVMSLAGSGQANHPVTEKGIEFLLASARGEGSWPIDTNLATWVTTLSVNALAAGSAGRPPAAPDARPELSKWLTRADREPILRWLLAQQFHQEHPYTHAQPGGWAWTDLPGGVPDADDTAGALLALRELSAEPPLRGEPSPTGAPALLVDRREVIESAIAGVNWLLNLQNSDGGIPTFCRGWTNLPFDRSAPDLTAHTLRAWSGWLSDLPVGIRKRVSKAMRRGLRYLTRAQRSDGAWIPLWFGNQHERDETNPIYGTARVISALTALARETGLYGIAFPDGSGGERPLSDGAVCARMIEHGAQWLVAAQKPDGSWGAPETGPASVEETALAVEALAGVAGLRLSGAAVCAAQSAATKGALWLIERVETGEWRQPSPIGFYFAKLWYYERLYPQIFTVAALSRVAHLLSESAAGSI